jgi:hypothetical protein
VDDVDAFALQFMRLFEDIHDDKRGDVFGSFGNHGTLLEGTTKSKIRIFVLMLINQAAEMHSDGMGSDPTN